MKSHTLRAFWQEYRALPEDARKAARKAYRIWRNNPFHPSLRFKCVHAEERVWAVRITLGYRALGVLDGDTVTWFWIGSHDDYLRQI